MISPLFDYLGPVTTPTFYMIYLFKVAVFFKAIYVFLLKKNFFATGSDNASHLGGAISGYLIA